MKRYILFALSVIVFTGCVHDITEDVQVEVGAEKVYASISSIDSRVELNSYKQAVWTKGDRIAIYKPKTLSFAEFCGETGDREGSFIVTETKSRNNSISESYAIYANDVAGIENYIWTDEEELAPIVRIPSTQAYLKDSYASNVNLMVGTTDDDKNYIFQTILGYLRLGLTGDKELKRLVLKSNGGEALAGRLALRLDDLDFIQYQDGATSTIVLDCGKGVQLSSSPTYFYFAVVPVVLKSGFTVTMEFVDGTSFSRGTEKRVNIERNYIQPMTDAKTDYDESDFNKVFVHHTVDTFIAPLVVATYATIDWGDGVISMLDEYTSYDYSDGASSHIVTIRIIEPESVTIPCMKGVTKLDISNF